MRNTARIEQNRSPKSGAERWFEEGRQDIHNLIGRLVAPYTDPSNVALHWDELRAESWAKVGQLMATGKLGRCATRQKFFAFLKVSIRNNLKTLVHKHAYSVKRTGVDLWSGHRSKPAYMRLDAPHLSFELSASASIEQMVQMLRDFKRILSPEELTVLRSITLSGSHIHGGQVSALRRKFQEYLRS